MIPVKNLKERKGWRWPFSQMRACILYYIQQNLKACSQLVSQVLGRKKATDIERYV